MKAEVRAYALSNTSISATDSGRGRKCSHGHDNGCGSRIGCSGRGDSTQIIAATL